jgi:hypothetical protein
MRSPGRLPRWLLLLGALGSLGLASVGAPEAEASPEVSYGRDIRPILSDRCFRCHGPDPSTREAELRLDTFEHATADRPDGAAIVPGDPDASELFYRITIDDPDEAMPPVGSHRARLDASEQALFRRWIEGGARYDRHWAFVPPRRASLPEDAGHPVDHFVRARLAEVGLAPSEPVAPELALRRLHLDLTGLPATPAETDAFLAERAQGDADEVWLRRIEKLFTEEPYRSRYAERMASPWLDQARYADTNGIHTDAGRQIWPWRDWVLEAYRTNMPFDRFVTEQLAGDLLPDATLAQRVASGFNRNHIVTDEGGAIDEEYLVEYAADRAETTASVLLGLTMNCARCHDHKFDPLSQEDYYGLFAFFSSNDEPGLYSQLPDPERAFEPFLEVPSDDQQATRVALEAELATARDELAAASPEDVAAMQRFLAELPAQLGLERAAAEVVELGSSGGATLTVTPAGTLLASGENPDTDVHTVRLRTDARDLRLIQLDVLGHASFTNGAPGRAGNGNAVLTGVRFEAVSVRDPQQRAELGIDWIWTDFAQDNEDWSLYRSFDERPNTGWAIAGHEDGGERVALFVTAEPFGYEGGTDVVVTLEYESAYAQHAFGHVRLGLAGLSEAGAERLPMAQGRWYHAGPFDVDDAGTAYARVFGPELADELDLGAEFEDADGARVRWQYRREFADGVVSELAGGVNVHYVAKELYAPTARTVELSLGSDDGFAVFVNGERAAAREVPRGVQADQDRVTVELWPGRNSLVLKVINTGGQSGFYYRALEAAERLEHDLVAALVDCGAHADAGAALAGRITHAWRRSESPEYRDGLERIAALEQRQAELEGSIPKTMVMRERAERRPTYVLERGVYDRPDEGRPVLPDVPRVFGGLEATAEQPATRLDLARWMTSPANPLVARVAVNRLWQMVFGTGLVATSGDFGSQGAWPSHPELLDWLAVEFVDSGWDVQALLTLLVSSDTYRQSSHVSPEVRAVDPEARLLAHYPRRRLDAERIRDQALFVSGLLEERFGGPSVKPYHPQGLWREVSMLASNTRTYERGEGADLWRRSLYTYWKRACPPPSLMTFDAPTREACVVRRATTNTPLQALVLWNDVQFLEAARVLAERTLGQAGDDAGRVRSMFRRCTGREPSARELALLADALGDHRERYAARPDDARLLIEAGERAVAAEVDAAELAAWTLLASALLNLHATITQG